MQRADKSGRRIERVLLIFSVVMLLTSGVVINYYFEPEVKVVERKELIASEYRRDAGKLSPILHIVVKDSEGNLKYSYTKEDDLVLKTFLNWTVGWMTNPEDAAVGFNAKDTSGTERTFLAYDSANREYGKLNAGGGYIQIGNGTTAPTRSDYALDEPRETKVTVSTPNYAVGNVTFSGTVTITSNYTASEVGFIMRMADSIFTARDVMMFRDNFTGIPVVVNDQITATYTIMLNNTGFTDNFGKYLAAAFRYVPVDATFTMIDTASNVVILRIWSLSAADSARITYKSGRTYIAMGTNAAAQQRTDVALTQMIGSYIGVSQPSHNSTTVITSASQTINAVTTIREAGYFVYWEGFTFMLWRSSSFSGVPTQPGYTVTITFRLRS